MGSVLKEAERDPYFGRVYGLRLLSKHSLASPGVAA